jgi:hypothetical protein
VGKISPGGRLNYKEVEPGGRLNYKEVEQIKGMGSLKSD